ncbi:MAG: SUMF1/EgtB/PvdO family nonheme iron enzyme [Candidatus Marinimicrobia bacterium]|nr:SUMF1/EgtB/PvdO family nonheme iron enzyme [Candidatus Neomarinimicrobiota bacterium]
MKYEVTNSQYMTYLEEALTNGDISVTSSTAQGNYSGDEYYGSGDYEYLDLDDNDCRISWDGSSYSVIEGYEDHPVVDVTWFGAHAFAQHYGLRLPDEYEWEKAARGMSGTAYPWGEDYGDDISDNANYNNSGDPWDNGTTPVGCYNGENGTTDSPSPYGAYDMAGNVWNWTHS